STPIRGRLFVLHSCNYSFNQSSDLPHTRSCLWIHNQTHFNHLLCAPIQIIRFRKFELSLGHSKRNTIPNKTTFRRRFKRTMSIKVKEGYIYTWFDITVSVGNCFTNLLLLLFFCSSCSFFVH